MYVYIFSKQLVAANLNQAPALQVSTCHPVALFCFLFQRLHVSTATLWRKPLPQPSTTSLSLTPASEHTWLDLEILRMHEGTCRHLERAVVSHPHYSKMFHNVQCPLQIFDMTPRDGSLPGWCTKFNATATSKWRTLTDLHPVKSCSSRHPCWSCCHHNNTTRESEM